MKLELVRVRAGYSDVPVINDVDMVAEAGKVTAVFGPNGAGKSTLLRTIFGLIRPSLGKILLDGEEVTGLGSVEMLKRGVSYVPQERSLFPDLTVEENLLLTAWSIRDNRESVRNGLKKVYGLFPALHENRNRPAALLSGGQQRMLEIARFMMLDPRLILLDEPSAGLAPTVYSEVLNIISMLRQKGITMLLVDQNIRATVKVAEHVYILESGRITFEGTREEFVQRMGNIVSGWLKF